MVSKGNFKVEENEYLLKEGHFNFITG